MPKTNSNLSCEIQNSLLKSFNTKQRKIVEELLEPKYINEMLLKQIPQDLIEASDVFTKHGLFPGHDHTDFYIRLENFDYGLNLKVNSSKYICPLAVQLQDRYLHLTCTKDSIHYPHLLSLMQQHELLGMESSALFKEVRKIPDKTPIDKLIEAWPQIEKYIPNGVLHDYKEELIKRTLPKPPRKPRTAKPQPLPLVIDDAAKATLLTLSITE